jgi:hypothetical protein
MLTFYKKDYSDEQLTTAYKNKYPVVEVDPSFMKGNEEYFGLLYSFDEEDFKFELNGFGVEQAVTGDYGVI